MTGFYVYESGRGNRFMAYHCDCCNLNVIFGVEEKPRTWCCGKWVECKQPEGLSKPQAPPFRALKYSDI